MIVGYRLKVNGGAYTDYEIDVGLVYSYLLSGLEGNTEYFVEIASYDGEGTQSAWSFPVSATTDSTPSLSMILDESGNAFIDDDGNAITTVI